MRASPGFIVIVLLLFSAVFVVLGALGVYRDIQFSHYGVKSMATIENLSRTSSGGRHGGTTYKAKYRFGTPNGEETVEVPVSYASFYNLHSGQKVAVLYLPGVPGESRLDDQVDADWHWHNHAGALAMGVFIASLGCFALWPTE